MTARRIYSRRRVGARLEYGIQRQTVNRSLPVIPLFTLTFTVAAGAQTVLDLENSVAGLLGLSIESARFVAESTDGLDALVSDKGDDRRWDVETLSFGAPALESISYQLPDASMPAANDPRLAEANLVAVADPETAVWTYLRVDESGHHLLGRVTLKDVTQDGRRDTLVSIYDPVSVVFPFPLSMGAAWTDSSTQTLEFQGSPPVPVETVVASHVVEGWGMLIAPDGEVPALRIRTDARVTSSGGQQSVQRRIRFVTPLPEEFTEETVHASGVEITVDSLESPSALNYRSLTLSRRSNVHIEGAPPTRVALSANYPNPFSSNTTIPLVLATPGHVSVAIFDVAGRRAAQLVDRIMPGGEHFLVWDAGTVSSGVYRVVLRSGSVVTSRLLVVQR